MASNYTTNYGLCQWEPGDSFVQTEFNQDNAKIDAAIQRLADTVEDQMAALGHDLYALVLQHHYEGMTTGWKKALFFDGFQDKALVASASESLFFRERAVCLCRTAQEDISAGYADDPTFANPQVTASHTAAGYCRITGLTIKTRCTYDRDVSQDSMVKVMVGRDTIYQATHPVDIPVTPGIQEITLPGVELLPGDVFSVSVGFGNTAYLCYPAADGSGTMGGTIHIDSPSGTAGSFTTPALDLPGRTALRAWVRYSGGAVFLSAQGADGISHPFASLGDRTTVNAAGTACTQREFALSAPPESGTLAFTMTLSLGKDERMEVFDYGVLLL